MSTTLYTPSRCTANLGEDLSKPYFIGEEKLDGSRYLLYLGIDPYARHAGNTLLSRRISTVDGKFVDRSDNVPHITNMNYSGLEGTVLDGEIMAADFLSTNSIMNSSPALAIQKQNSIGECVYHVFDVIAFRGRDIRGLPLEQRRKVLEEVVRRMANPFIKPIAQVRGNLEDYFTQIVSKGGEGIIVKDLRQGYGCGWAKFKKSYDVSCVVSGYLLGEGKYSKQIGSLLLSVYHAGKLVEIGRASGFSDEIRARMSRDFDAFKGKVVDIFAQEIQDSKRSAGNPVGRLRHPTFHRFRDDVNPEDCTSEKLWSDLKSKVRGSRSKD
jgi:ATP-dependent DNA ligase